MTIGKIHDFILKAGGNDNTVVESDSGWECCATSCDGISYDAQKNVATMFQRECGPISFVGNFDGDIHEDDIKCYGGCKIPTGDCFIGRSVRVSSIRDDLRGKVFVFDGHIPTIKELVKE